MTAPIDPIESTEPCIGILGGGQLGRMLCAAAQRMGYRVIVWTGGDNSGAARNADIVLAEPFDCQDAFQTFITEAEVATVEFENIPKELIAKIAEHLPVMPGQKAVSICQNRELEKTFLADNGIPTVAFQIVENASELADALQNIPGDVILKTVESGYDGKGQMLVEESGRPDAETVWNNFVGGRAIVEQKIDLAAEVSVMVVRNQKGDTITFDPAENEHKNHILDLSIVPARLSEAQLTEAKSIATRVAQALDYVGVIGVEFFIDQSGYLLVNEMAPRPHNSGHHTIDACATSQFEQQFRVITGLTLGSTALLKPCVMWNLLGNIWIDEDTPPDWTPILSTPSATLHLYGKRSARDHRKMGHVTFVADTVEEALKNAQACQKAYGWIS